MPVAATSAPPTVASGLAARLALLARAGDGPAWEAVSTLALPWMQRVCQGLLRDPSLADDAVQESLLALRAHAGAFHPRPGTNADADDQALRWIVRLSANCARMVRRGEQRAQRRGREAPAGEPVAVAPPAGLDPAEAEAVRTAVDALPERERAAVVLHVLARLPYEQVARELRCPLGSAKTWVRRGLERLRRTLRGGDHGEAMVLAVLQAPAASGMSGAPPHPPLPLVRPLAPTAVLPTPVTGVLMASLPAVALTTAALLVGMGATLHLRAQDPPAPAAAPPRPSASPPAATTTDPGKPLPPMLDMRMTCDLTGDDLTQVTRFFSRVTGISFAVEAIGPHPITLHLNNAPLRSALDLIAALSDTAMIGVQPVRFLSPDADRLAQQLDRPCDLTLHRASWSDAVAALWAAGVPVIDCAPAAAHGWTMALPPRPGATLRGVLDALTQPHGQHWTVFHGRLLLGDGPIGPTPDDTARTIRERLLQEVHLSLSGNPLAGAATFCSKISGIPVLVDPQLQEIPISMEVDHMTLGSVLTEMGRQAQADLAMRSGALVLARVGSPLRPRAAPTGLGTYLPLGPATASGAPPAAP